MKLFLYVALLKWLQSKNCLKFYHFRHFLVSMHFCDVRCENLLMLTPKYFLIHRQTIHRTTLKPKFGCLNEIISLCGTSEMAPEQNFLKIGSFSAFSCKYGFLWGHMWKSTHAYPKYFLIHRQTIHTST